MIDKCLQKKNDVLHRHAYNLTTRTLSMLYELSQVHKLQERFPLTDLTNGLSN